MERGKTRRMWLWVACLAIPLWGCLPGGGRCEADGDCAQGRVCGGDGRCMDGDGTQGGSSGGVATSVAGSSSAGTSGGVSSRGSSGSVTGSSSRRASSSGVVGSSSVASSSVGATSGVSGMSSSAAGGSSGSSAATGGGTSSSAAASSGAPSSGSSSVMGSSSSLPASSSANPCGNGLANAPEACDDGNTANGDGCSDGCTLEAGWDCNGFGPNTCFRCGDGVLQGPETCDDGNTAFGDGCTPVCNVEGGGWTCAGQPSVCQLCGNNVAEGTEACDGQDVRGLGCMALGRRMQGGIPPCVDNCGRVDVAALNCGPFFQDGFDLDNAFQDARNTPGGQIIAIPTGRYDINSTLNVDRDFSGGWLVVQPLSGPVTLVGSTAQVLVDVTANDVVFRDLIVEDADEAFRLNNNNTSEPGATLERILFTNPTVRPDRLVYAQRGNHKILACRFETTQPANLGNGDAIVLDQASGDVVAQNTIHGPYLRGISVLGVQNNPVRLDHNSVRILQASSAPAVALLLQDGRVCVRNNVFMFEGPTFAGYPLQFNGGGAMASMAECGNAQPVGFNAAVATMGGSPCMGGCGQWCPGPLCDVMADPQWAMGDPALCLGPASPLRDAALDLGYDLVDNDPAFFRGVSPDVGAREATAGRAYGLILSTCP